MITDPRFAPRRTDLPWLRRRYATRVPAHADGSLQDYLSGHSHGEHHHQDAEPAQVPPSSPRPSPPSPPPPPSPQPPPPQAVSSSLDLDEPAPAAPAPRPAAVTPSASAPTRRTRTDLRVGAGERLILTPGEPTVTLTRLQTGIGTLSIEAAVSDEVGDLRLGAAYELSSDLEMIMQMTQGSRLAPPHSKRPILVGNRDRFEKVAVDLRQCRDLRRMVVYAFSEKRQPLTWGGTLVVTTFGGARVEVALDSVQGGDLAVLLSIYQVRGEFVLRAEMQAMFGDVRDACRAYGFDKITWLDGRTPVE